MKLHNGKRSGLTARTLKNGKVRLLTCALGILMILCAVIGFAGVDLGGIAEATASGTTTLVLSEETGTGASATSKISSKQSKDYKTLINALAKTADSTSTVTNYKAMAKLVTGEVKADKLSSYKVQFGGYTWNIAYVSHTRATSTSSTALNTNTNAVGDEGDIVVTLFMADVGKYAGMGSTVISRFNTHAVNSDTANYPSSMYSTSLVRSTLNGTPYANSNTATSLTGGAQNSAWTRFTAEDQLGSYISTPAQLAWQETESENSITNYTYYFPNDAYGTPKKGSTAGQWHSAVDGIPGKANYADWRVDKLWLPSMSETGWSTSEVGLWGLTASQRGLTHNSGDSESASSSAGDTRYSWLRSGYYNDANYAYLLDTSGGSTVNNTDYYYAVRPALHLNLKSAASAAGVELPTQVEDATYNNANQVAALQGVDDNIELVAAKLKQTDRTGASKTVNLDVTDTNAIEVRGENVFVTQAGEYTATFALVGTDELPIWDGHTINPEDQTPARYVGGEYLEVLYWELTDASGAITYSIQNQDVTFTLQKATPSVTSVVYDGTATLYSGGSLPTLSHTGIDGEARLDSGQTLTEGTKDYNWTFYPEDDYNYNDKQTGTVSLTVKKPELKTLEATFDVSAYRAAVLADSSKKIYSSMSLADVKKIIKEYITIDRAVKEDGNDFEDVPAIKDGFTLGYDTGKTKLEGGKDNVLTLSFGGVTCKINGGIPVLTVDLVSITVSTQPTTREYEALQTFRTAGMVVTATYTDGSEQHVAGYTVSYNNGHTELWYGDTSVTITYSETNEAGTEFEKTTTANVTVNQIEFEASSIKLENAQKDYTGSAQTIAYTGDLPEGITAVYSYELNGSSVSASGVVNVNEYTVIVTLTKDSNRGVNYKINGNPRLTATLTINKVAYEGVENITFADGEAQYSASSKAGALTVDRVPEGNISVAYEYYSDAACTNKLEESEIVNMGEYYVKAVFTVDGNHKDISPRIAKLTIIAHKLVKGEISGIESSYTYKGEAWKPEPTVTVLLGGKDTELTKDTDYTVAYSTENFTAGTFVTVTVTGIGNFSSSVDIEFQITKAMLKFTWGKDAHGDNCVYNGTAHSAVIEIDADSVCDNDKSAITSQALAQFIKDGVSFITYTAVSGGNSSVTAAGEYKPAFTSFPSDSPWNNYNYQFTNENFTFTVKEAILPTISFENSSVVYDGETHYLHISLPDGSIISVTEDGKFDTTEIDVQYYSGATTSLFNGEKNVLANGYPVRAVITLKTDNYHFSDYTSENSSLSNDGKILTLNAHLTITPKTIGTDGTEAEDVTVSGIEVNGYTYNGKEIVPDIKVSVELKAGTATLGNRDYTLVYDGDDHINARENVTVTITGTGNYAGTIVKTFDINPANIDYKRLDEGATYDDDKVAHYTYNGKPQGISAEFTGVADRDKGKVYPELFYMTWEAYNAGVASGKYEILDGMPTEAGSYVVAARFTETYTEGNYKSIEPRYAFFDIDKATPTVTTPKFTEYNGTDKLFVGQLLPEITLNTASLNEVVTEVAGTVTWKLVGGKQPVLALNSNEYTWVFTPDDTRNFNPVEGTIRLEASTPTFASMTVKWNTEDGEQPFLWSSTTLEALREYLWVEATLDDGTNYGRVTTLYSLSGSWGASESPKLAGHDSNRSWNITVTLQGVNDIVLSNVAYNKVTLDYIEIRAAGGEIKKHYNALETFDTSTINVVAHYQDGSVEENITGYDVIYPQADSRLWFGNKTVTIRYRYDGITKEAEIDELDVKRNVFDTSNIAFGNTNNTVPFDGGAHSLKVENEEDFTIGDITYVYSKKTEDGNWVVLDGVTEVSEAGEYSVEAVFTIKDDPLYGEGVYTRNYTVDYSSKIAYLTVGKIKYDGADTMHFDSSVTAVYNGDTVNLYTADIKDASTGVSDEVWAIARYEYRVSLGDEPLSAEDAVHAGDYIVTIIFDADENHEPIASVRISLKVNKANPTVRPVIVVDGGHPLKDMHIGEIVLKTTEGDTEGSFAWVSYGDFDKDNYVLHNGSNQVFYTFTPINQRDYNVLENVSFIITAKNNYPTHMFVSISQGDTELFDSYSLDKLLELAGDENEDLTISVYILYNDKTSELVTDYEVKLASGGDMLTRDDRGRCYLIFSYTIEGEVFTYTDAYVTVHTNGLGSIVATFNQNGAEIFTSDDISALLGLLADGASGVSLTVNSYYADGEFKAVLDESEYTLSGDWSGMTADGEFAVTVTANVNGETASTTFKIQVTLVILTEITVEYDQNKKSIYASDDITALENMIADGGVALTVTAHYNDNSQKTVEFGANGYNVTIDTDKFEVADGEVSGKNTVTVHYTEGGIAQTVTFEVDVTAVLVVGLSAKINKVDSIIYTDTALTDVEKLLTVIAYYNDGTEAEVTDFELVMPDGSNKLTAGTQVSVNVNYTNDGDRADYFKPYELIIGVIKHETVITFNGQTVYTYDGSAHEISGGATTNHADDETLSYEIDGAPARVFGAKDYTLVITSEETEDYYPATLTVTVTVEKADYDMSDVKFEDGSAVYDGNKHYLTVSGSLPMNVTMGGYKYVLDGVECGEASATNAGVYTVIISFVAYDTVNYNAVPDMTATLTIEKAEVEIDETGLFANVYAYNGAEQTITGATIVKADDGAEIIYNNNTFTDVPDGGVVRVEISVTEGVNYKAFFKTAEITVNRAKLTITANPNTITFGDVPSNDGVSSAGFVNGESIENLDGALSYVYNYSQYGNVGEYEITIGGVSSENYDIVFVSGKLTVEQAEATAEWVVGNHVYDGKAHNPTAYFTDLFGTKIALTVTVSYKSGGIVNEAIGVGDYIATASSLNPNYKVSGTTAEFTITAETDNWIRFDFRKDYTATYGSVPETAEELALLAEELINQSYVRVDYNANGEITDLDTVIRLMTVRLEVDGNTLVNNTTPVGRYNICFEFKPEYAETYANYAISQTFEESENTNLGRLVIQPRKLTIDWGKTEFKFDGEAHLLTATVEGFINGAPVSFTMTEDGGEFSFDVDGTVVKLKLSVKSDFTAVGGHVIVATIDDENYTITNPYETVSIGEASGLSTLSWILIGIACACGLIAIIAVIVASRRKSGGSDGYDDGGFNEPYYGD